MAFVAWRNAQRRVVRVLQRCALHGAVDIDKVTPIEISWKV
jgi:hypothetical protein